MTQAQPKKWLSLKIIPFAIFMFLTTLISSRAQAETVLDKDVSVAFNKTKLGNVLSQIESQANVRFIYSADVINVERRVSINLANEKLGAVLEKILSPEGVSFRTHGNKILLTDKKSIGLMSPSTTLNLTTALPPVRGKVVDATGEGMPGVNVSIKNTNRGTQTEADGTFTLDLQGNETLVFSFIGYETLEVPATGKTFINITMKETANSLNEIIVTGTRSSGRTKMDTPVPVDVIQVSQVVNDIGQVDINQILTFIAPSFQSSRQAISDGTDHVDPAQLRGLGPDQVLVLINGKRRHQSALVNANGTVNRGTVGTDMNAIPATAVEKIEILRDGAAAQYGSDAIAGVINIVLKKQIGLSGNVSGGTHITEYQKNYAFNQLNNVAGSDAVNVTDGTTAQVGINYGLKVGDKGFVNITGEYTSRGLTNRSGLYTGQVFPLMGGQNVDQATLDQRGLTRDDFDMRIGNSEVKGGGVMVNAELPINDKMEVYAFGGFNNKKGNAAGFYRYPTGIPASVRTNVFTKYPNGFLPEINSDVTDVSFAAGLRGQLGTWNFDLSNTFGNNVFDFGVDNSVNYTEAFGTADFQQTFDAGGLTFQQNTTNLDFSKKYAVLAGLNVAAGVEVRFEQFGIRAGEESSYRNFNTASGAAAGAQVFGGFLPSNSGTFNRNNQGIYVDLEQDFTDKFLVSGALRFENYSDFGSTLNYKLASRYKITEGFALRASVSSGFRAPSLQQRYYARSSTLFVPQNGQLVPVESGTFTNDSEVAQILGIPQLQQETSQSITIGTTIQLANALELTVDAYQIDIDDRIVLTNNFTAGGNADLATRLAAANANTANVFTNAIDTRSRGIEAVINYAKALGNNQSLKMMVAGAFIDNEVKKDEAGNAIVRSSAILEATGQKGNYFNREDQSRVEVANPQSKISAMGTYSVKKFSFMVRAVRFGEVTYLDPTMNPARPEAFPTNAFNANARETLDQTFSPKIVTDVTVRYDLSKNLGFAIGANNLFDVYQDVHTHANNVSLGRFVYSRRVQQMGFNGRYVFGRVTFGF